MFLCCSYASPGSQGIQDTFTDGEKVMWADGLGVIYARIDGRGSAHKGYNMMHTIYKKMGSVEVEDQIDVVM